jgi:hypothetical protein
LIRPVASLQWYNSQAIPVGHRRGTAPTQRRRLSFTQTRSLSSRLHRVSPLLFRSFRRMESDVALHLNVRHLPTNGGRYPLHVFNRFFAKRDHFSHHRLLALRDTFAINRNIEAVFAAANRSFRRPMFSSDLSTSVSSWVTLRTMLLRSDTMPVRTSTVPASTGSVRTWDSSLSCSTVHGDSGE